MLYTSWGAKTTEIALRCDWASCDGAQSDGAKPATEHNLRRSLKCDGAKTITNKKKRAGTSEAINNMHACKPSNARTCKRTLDKPRRARAPSDVPRGTVTKRQSDVSYVSLLCRGLSNVRLQVHAVLVAAT
jgi:hypothetical protein